MSSFICFCCKGPPVGVYHCQFCPSLWQQLTGVFRGDLASGSLSLLFEGSKSSSCQGRCLDGEGRTDYRFGRDSQALALANHLQSHARLAGYLSTHRSASKVQRDDGELSRESTSHKFLGQLSIARGSLRQTTLIVQVTMKCRQLLYQSIMYLVLHCNVDIFLLVMNIRC